MVIQSAPDWKLQDRRTVPHPPQKTWLTSCYSGFCLCEPRVEQREEKTLECRKKREDHIPDPPQYDNKNHSLSLALSSSPCKLFPICDLMRSPANKMSQKTLTYKKFAQFPIVSLRSSPRTIMICRCVICDWSISLSGLQHLAEQEVCLSIIQWLARK